MICLVKYVAKKIIKYEISADIALLLVDFVSKMVIDKLCIKILIDVFED